MNNISAVIVVKDNPIHIMETLGSIDFVSEIIVVDIGMVSALKKKLKEMKQVKIVPVNKDVRYVEQIREKTKSFAKNDYLLFLDPDEVVSDQLQEVLLKEYAYHDFISIPRKNIIFGKWIQHSRWWPDYQIRLFKKNAVSWPQKLHAQPDTKGTEYKIEATEQNGLIHYNYENLTEFLTKMMRYAQSEAQEIIDRKKSYRLIDATSESIQEFISRFFGEQGYKDGMHGFVLAFLQMMYKMLVFFYVWEKKKYENYLEQEITKESLHFFKQGLFETSYWMMKEKLVNVATTIRFKVMNRLLKDL